MEMADKKDINLEIVDGPEEVAVFWVTVMEVLKVMMVVLYLVH